MFSLNSAAVSNTQQRQVSERSIQFIAPTLILLILFNIFPLFYSLYLSFTDFSVIERETSIWVGFANYGRLLNDEQMWQYFATTGRFAFLSVGLQTVIGFALAMPLREKWRGGGIITALILILMMLSPVVVGLSFLETALQS